MSVCGNAGQKKVDSTKSQLWSTDPTHDSWVLTLNGIYLPFPLETDPNSTFALIASAIHHLWFPWHNLHVEFGNTVEEGSERLPKLHWKVLCKYYSTNREGIYHVRIKQIIKGSCNRFRLDAEWSPNSKPRVWDNQRGQSAQASSKTAKMAWQKSENYRNGLMVGNIENW